MKWASMLCFLSLAGCAGLQSGQQAQVAYVQACAAYGAAFSTALQLREAGKLTPVQIDHVTIADQIITPICTGPMPSNPAAETAQIFSAAAQLETLK